MKALIFVLLISTAPLVGLVQAQQPNQDAPKPAAPADPMMLTADEMREVQEAFAGMKMANEEVSQAVRAAARLSLDDVGKVTAALGNIQRGFAHLESAERHFGDMREKHKALRPDCAQCEYSPDLKRLVKQP